MNEKIELFDVVALLDDLPEHGLRRGEVGTIVEELAPAVWLIEFSDNEGQEYAMLELQDNQFIKLYYAPVFPPPAEKALA